MLNLSRHLAGQTTATSASTIQPHLANDILL